MSGTDYRDAPDEERLSQLCAQLSSEADELDASSEWPVESLRKMGEAGVFAWFVPKRLGGAESSDAELTRGYLQLAKASLLSTFILTQRAAACRRVIDGENEDLAERLAPALLDPATYVTIGTSHLTTSRRHVSRPVMTARETEEGFLLNGYTPWVTGGAHAAGILTGATLDDGRQILVWLDGKGAGVSHGDPAKLVALSGSHTAEVRCKDVLVPRDSVVRGPVANVMAHSGGGAGGLQTSTLGVGLASAAIEYLAKQAIARTELIEPRDGLRHEKDELTSLLLRAAEGELACTADELRARANSLALRATQAALTAAKGAGFVAGHPAGRWCREALFFLVWSCPAGVAAANLCELAGLRAE